jgi:hypothetical protein
MVVSTIKKRREQETDARTLVSLWVYNETARANSHGIVA